MNRTLKILLYYVLAVVCLFLYFWMEYSPGFQQQMEVVNRSRADWKFGSYAMIGLVKYGSLVIAISLVTLTTCFLLREKWQQR